MTIFLRVTAQSLSVVSVGTDASINVSASGFVDVDTALGFSGNGDFFDSSGEVGRTVRLGGGVTCRGGPRDMVIRPPEVGSLGSGIGIEARRAAVGLDLDSELVDADNGTERRGTSGAGAVGDANDEAKVSELIQTSSLSCRRSTTGLAAG